MYCDYGGEESKSSAVSLLKECDREHLKCRSLHPSRRPKRLLRIDTHGENDRFWIFLDVTPQPPPTPIATKYSALSYCWGRDQEYKLKLSSQTTYEKGVAFCRTMRRTWPVKLQIFPLSLEMPTSLSLQAERVTAGKVFFIQYLAHPQMISFSVFPMLVPMVDLAPSSCVVTVAILSIRVLGLSKSICSPQGSWNTRHHSSYGCVGRENGIKRRKEGN
jgi:hypothetical protein